MMRGAMLAAAFLTASAVWATAAPEPGIVTTQAIPAGAVYASIDGRTLYTYDRDAADKSVCVGDCARIWKPLAAAWIARPMGDWTILVRDDGSRQWAFRGKPLYNFAGDHHPGEANGDGAEHLWRAVVTARKFVPPGTIIWESDFGPAFAAEDGRALYVLAELRFNPLGTKRHTGRNLGLTECTDECIKTWKPLQAAAGAAADGDWSIVTRPDGVRQWAYKDWPVFTNIHDSKPGDTFGEGVTIVKGGLSGLSWEVATL